MHYRIYNTEDFLFDESFRQWTSGTSAEATAYWEQWLKNNPDRAEVVRQAQELIHALNDYYQDDVTETRLASEQKRLIQLAAEQRLTTSNIPLWQQSWIRWSVAASIVLVIGLGYWLNIKNTLLEPESAYKQLPQAATTPLLEKRNDTDKILPVLLNDGSLVTLQPKSRLSYPKQFAQHNRTVFLKGEAFFDVVRNPDRPFLIYANQTVTKVLGTSFLVRAFDHEKNVVVTVRTGRVSVFKQADYEKAQQSGTHLTQGVVLTPNQQITFNPAQNQLVKALIQQSKDLSSTSINPEMVFEDTPVSKVFSDLEKKYGLKINYNAKELSACLINLSFSDESLLEQLDIISQTIDATYEIHDGQIVVFSKGCR